MNRLKKIGNIPVTTAVIESLYPELKSLNKKVVWPYNAYKQGKLVKLPFFGSQYFNLNE